MRWLIATSLLFAGCAQVIPGGVRLDDDDVNAPDASEPVADRCTDGEQNGPESDVDCGGDCEPCALGSACAASGDCGDAYCLSQTCVISAPSCAALLAADPTSPSGTYTLDLDADGPIAAFSSYCEMSIAGGGWQLVSYVPADGLPVAIVSDVFCDSLTACAGHIDPLQVSGTGEVLVMDPAEGNWLVYGGFSAGALSGLRYLSLELGLVKSESCDAPHTCNDRSIDPELNVVQTSGFPVTVNPPLAQFWRRGGWWVSADPDAGNVNGNIHSTAYPLATGGGNNRISQRTAADANANLLTTATQAVYYRQGN